MFDLGLRCRLALAVTWAGAQLALIATGGLRDDGAFGFRMFPESSTIAISLSREIATRDAAGARLVVPIDGGRWVARDAGGVPREHAWTDRVRDPILSRLDVTVNAAYGHRAQLARLAAALDDVAAHVTSDAETTRLLADVIVTHNGRVPTRVRLASRPRW
jgi:hypothetical protein